MQKDDLDSFKIEDMQISEILDEFRAESLGIKEGYQILKINGKDVKANIKPNILLSTFIRENLNLTGTHIGCDTSQCGACAIHLNGDAVKSCAIVIKSC